MLRNIRARCSARSALIAALLALAPLASASANVDLTFQSFTGPATASPGQFISMTDVVKNLGTEIAPGFYVDYFLSPGAAYSPETATPLGASRYVWELAAGSTDTASMPFYAPSTPGGYYIIAVADGPNSVVESDETNNTIAAYLTVTAGGGGGGSGAGISVTTVTCPASASAGSVIAINDKAANAGPGVADPFFVYYYLSTDASYSPATDYYLGSRSVLSLPPGTTSQGSTSAALPYAAAGSYYVIAVASTSDSNQADNVLASRAMTVTNDVNLAMMSLDVPASFSVGQTIIVTDTVKNFGGTTAAGTFRVGYYLSADATLDAGDALMGYRVVASLAAGASNNGSVSLTVPSVAQGTYTVLAKADAMNSIAETNEADNVLASAGTSSVSNSLDLTELSVTAPATAAAGQVIPVTDTVKNMGIISTGPFHVSYYLSTTPTYSSGSTALGSRTVSSLAGGVSDTGLTYLALPSGLAQGNYYVVAYADSLNEATETDETNNWKASPAVSIAHAIDLTVSAVSAPASASLGQPITVNDTVNNIGVTAAGAFVVKYYLSTDNVFSPATDIPLGEYRTVSSLAGGASDSGSTLVTIPRSTAEGDYYIIAVADPQNVVGDADTTNNARAAASTTHLTANADLAVSYIGMPDTVVAGAAVTITNTVQNVGVGAAGAFGVSLYLSTDQTFSAGTDVFLASRTVASLAPGGVSTAGTSTPFPQGIRGPYYVIAVADPAGAISESNTANNISTQAVQVGLPTPGTPGKPTVYSLGSSSITWQWTAAANATQYLIYTSTGSGPSLSSKVATTTGTLGGLAPNTTGSVAVIASNPDGSGVSSGLSDPAYTLAEPPAGLSLQGVWQTSATITWGLGANPAWTVAQVQRSNDGVTYTTVITSAVVRLDDASLLACTPYRYRVHNRNGDGVYSDLASVAEFHTADSTPSAPSALQAASLAARRIALSWSPSTSEGVTGYRLYWDNGTGTIDYGTPKVALSSSTTSWTSEPLTLGTVYSFGLRANNRCGIEEKNAGVMASAGAIDTLPSVRAVIQTPASGQHLAGNGVSLVAVLSLGTEADVRSVLFQYRALGSPTWLNVPATDLDLLNPAVKPPYFIHFNADSLPAGATVYELRAVATSASGASDAAAPSVSVVHDPADAPADVDVSETISGKVITRVQKVDNAVPSTVQAGSEASRSVAKLELPAGALNSPSAMVTVVNNPAARPAPPEGALDLGLVTQLTLSNGQTAFSNGKTAAVTLGYPDADGDGVIDGTAGRVDRLAMYTAETAAGPWTRIAAVKDPAAKAFVGVTSHLSFYALFAAAAPDLKSLRVYPNPFKPDGGNADEGAPYAAGNPNSGILFDNVPASVDIRIYTMTGQSVARFGSSASGGKLQWDARNDKGRDVASGLYFAVITSPGQEKVVKKLLIVR